MTDIRLTDDEKRQLIDAMCTTPPHVDIQKHDGAWACTLPDDPPFAAVESLIAARLRVQAEQIATAIEDTFADPDRVRPRTPGGLLTDFLNDADWCARIARDHAAKED